MKNSEEIFSESLHLRSILTHLMHIKKFKYQKVRVPMSSGIDVWLQFGPKLSVHQGHLDILITKRQI